MFKERLNNVFDIAHSEALTMVKNSEDAQFLCGQPEPGRVGSMAGVDRKQVVRDKKVQKRKRAAESYQSKITAKASSSTQVSHVESSSDHQLTSEASDEEDCTVKVHRLTAKE